MTDIIRLLDLGCSAGGTSWGYWLAGQDSVAPGGDFETATWGLTGGAQRVPGSEPFAATGTRILPTLAKILNENKAKRGLISICTAGGMGVTAIVEC